MKKLLSILVLFSVCVKAQITSLPVIPPTPTFTSINLGITTPGIIGGTLGAITLTAAGTNKDITLIPTSGMVSITPASGPAYMALTGTTSESQESFLNTGLSSGSRVWRFGIAATGAGGAANQSFSIQRLNDTNSAVTDTILTATSTITSFPRSSNVLIGTTTDASTGKLQVVGNIALSSTALFVKPGGTIPIFTTNTAITSGAGAQSGTLLNSPAAGNPTKWIPIDDNGTIRYIPAW